jgi:hypothetical protein
MEIDGTFLTILGNIRPGRLNVADPLSRNPALPSLTTKFNPTALF